MDKTTFVEQRRVFLIEALPEPLTRASAHIQIFDNYLLDTDLRLRSIRDPEPRSWKHSLQKRVPDVSGAGRRHLSEMVLTDTERERFEIFDGHEIRKNRYFHEFDGLIWDLDVYLGKLWGLNTAAVSGDNVAKLVVPPFAVFEATADKFFEGAQLVTKTFEDLQRHLAATGDALRVRQEVVGDE